MSSCLLLDYMWKNHNGHTLFLGHGALFLQQSAPPCTCLTPGYLSIACQDIVGGSWQLSCWSWTSSVLAAVPCLMACLQQSLLGQHMEGHHSLTIKLDVLLYTEQNKKICKPNCQWEKRRLLKYNYKLGSPSWSIYLMFANDAEVWIYIFFFSTDFKEQSTQRQCGE